MESGGSVDGDGAGCTAVRGALSPAGLRVAGSFAGAACGVGALLASTIGLAIGSFTAGDGTAGLVTAGLAAAGSGARAAMAAGLAAAGSPVTDGPDGCGCEVASPAARFVRRAVLAPSPCAARFSAPGFDPPSTCVVFVSAFAAGSGCTGDGAGSFVAAAAFAARDAGVFTRRGCGAAGSVGWPGAPDFARVLLGFSGLRGAVGCDGDFGFPDGRFFSTIQLRTFFSVPGGYPAARQGA